MRSVAHVGALERSDKSPGGTPCAGATGTSDAMNEIFSLLGQIVVDDMRDVIDVDAARGDVGSDEYTAITIFEALERVIPLALRAVSVDGGDFVMAPFEKFGKPVGSLFGGDEYEERACLRL